MNKVSQTSPADLIASPLYQVNLVLWMATKNNGGRVRPVFANAGYEVLFIERALNLPPELKQTLVQAGVTFVDPASPDFILAGAKKSYVILECKKTMFGADSSTAAQSRSLLLQVPRIFELALVKKAGSVTNVSLIYLSRQDSKHDLLDGINALAEHLKKAKFKTITAGALSLHVSGKAIRLRQSGNVPQPLAHEVGIDALEVQEVADDSDPRPLYLIPWLPDTESENDEYNKRAFAERVKLSAAQVIDSARAGTDVEILLSDVLGLLTLGYDKNLSNAAYRRLKQESKGILEKRFRSVKDVTILSLPDGAGWALTLKDDAAKESILNGLRAYEPPDPQVQLF